MKVVICGGCDFEEREFISAELDRLHARYQFDVVLEGDARGVASPVIGLIAGESRY